MRPAWTVASTAPRKVRPCHGLLRERLRLVVASTVTSRSGSTSVMWAGCALGQRAALRRKAADARGRGRHDARDSGPVEQARAHEHLADDRQGGLEAEHAEGRVGEGVLLVVPGVRRVVGRDGVDRAVDERGPQRLDVLRRPQRRVDLVDGVVADEQVGRQREVVRA